ncbi:hypothetical protein ACOME3_000260 [Neoechinorhynchus agilis]
MDAVKRKLYINTRSSSVNRKILGLILKDLYEMSGAGYALVYDIMMDTEIVSRADTYTFSELTNGIMGVLKQTFTQEPVKILKFFLLMMSGDVSDGLKENRSNQIPIWLYTGSIFNGPFIFMESASWCESKKLLYGEDVCFNYEVNSELKDGIANILSALNYNETPNMSFEGEMVSIPPVSVEQDIIGAKDIVYIRENRKVKQKHHETHKSLKRVHKEKSARKPIFVRDVRMPNYFYDDKSTMDILDEINMDLKNMRQSEMLLEIPAKCISTGDEHLIRNKSICDTTFIKPQDPEDNKSAVVNKTSTKLDKATQLFHTGKGVQDQSEEDILMIKCTDDYLSNYKSNEDAAVPQDEAQETQLLIKENEMIWPTLTYRIFELRLESTNEYLEDGTIDVTITDCLNLKEVTSRKALEVLGATVSDHSSDVKIVQCTTKNADETENGETFTELEDNKLSETVNLVTEVDCENESNDPENEHSSKPENVVKILDCYQKAQESSMKRSVDIKGVIFNPHSSQRKEDLLGVDGDNVDARKILLDEIWRNTRKQVESRDDLSQVDIIKCEHSDDPEGGGSFFLSNDQKVIGNANVALGAENWQGKGDELIEKDGGDDFAETNLDNDGNSKKDDERVCTVISVGDETWEAIEDEILKDYEKDDWVGRESIINTDFATVEKDRMTYTDFSYLSVKDCAEQWKGRESNQDYSPKTKEDLARDQGKDRELKEKSAFGENLARSSDEEKEGLLHSNIEQTFDDKDYSNEIGNVDLLLIDSQAAKELFASSEDSLEVGKAHGENGNEEARKNNAALGALETSQKEIEQLIYKIECHRNPDASKEKVIEDESQKNQTALGSLETPEKEIEQLIYKIECHRNTDASKEKVIEDESQKNQTALGSLETPEKEIEQLIYKIECHRNADASKEKVIEDKSQKESKFFPDETRTYTEMQKQKQGGEQKRKTISLSRKKIPSIAWETAFSKKMDFDEKKNSSLNKLMEKWVAARGLNSDPLKTSCADFRFRKLLEKRLKDLSKDDLSFLEGVIRSKTRDRKNQIYYQLIRTTDEEIIKSFENQSIHKTSIAKESLNIDRNENLLRRELLLNSRDVSQTIPNPLAGLSKIEHINADTILLVKQNKEKILANPIEESIEKKDANESKNNTLHSLMHKWVRARGINRNPLKKSCSDSRFRPILDKHLKEMSNDDYIFVREVIRLKDKDRLNKIYYQLLISANNELINSIEKEGHEKQKPMKESVEAQRDKDESAAVGTSLDLLQSVPIKNDVYDTIWTSNSSTKPVVSVVPKDISIVQTVKDSPYESESGTLRSLMNRWVGTRGVDRSPYKKSCSDSRFKPLLEKHLKDMSKDDIDFFSEVIRSKNNENINKVFYNLIKSTNEEQIRKLEKQIQNIESEKGKNRIK